MSDHGTSFAIDPEYINSEKSLLAIAEEEESKPSSRRSTVSEADEEMLTSIYNMDDTDYVSTRALASSMSNPEDLSEKPLRSAMAQRKKFPATQTYEDPESSDTSNRRLNSTYETFPDVSAIVAEDFNRIKSRQMDMVECAKKKLSKLFQEYIYNSQENSLVLTEDSVSTVKSDLDFRIEDTNDPMQQKTSLDVRFVSLSDDDMIKEAKREVSGHPIVKKIQEDAVDEFVQQQKEAEEQVTVVKKKLEDYLIRTIKTKSPIESQETDAMLEEMWTSFTTKALNDLQKGQNKSQKQIDKAKLNIRQQLQVFATNPAGHKTNEEIESEQYVKQALFDFQDKVRRDLVFTKDATDQVTNRTKEQLKIPFTESRNFEPHKFPMQDFSTRPCTDFQLDTKAGRTVTEIKQKLKDTTSVEYSTSAVSSFSKKTKEEFAKSDASMKENVSYAEENIEKVIDFENPDDVIENLSTTKDTPSRFSKC